MGLAKQQVHAQIDPKPDKEEEDEDGQLRDPSFKGPAVQGEAPPQSDALSSESCIPIEPWLCAARLPWLEAASLVHPAGHRRAVELSCSKHRVMNRPAPNSWAMLSVRPRAAPVNAPASWYATRAE